MKMRDIWKLFLLLNTDDHMLTSKKENLTSVLDKNCVYVFIFLTILLASNGSSNGSSNRK